MVDVFGLAGVVDRFLVCATKVEDISKTESRARVMRFKFVLLFVAFVI